MSSQAARTSFKIRIPGGYNLSNGQYPEKLKQTTLTMRIGAVLRNWGDVLKHAFTSVLQHGQLLDNFDVRLFCGPEETQQQPWNAAFIDLLPNVRLLVSSSLQHPYWFAFNQKHPGLYMSVLSRPPGSPDLNMSRPVLAWPTGKDTDVSPYVHGVRTCRHPPISSFQPLGISHFRTRRQTVLAVVAYSRPEPNLHVRHAIEFFNITGIGHDAHLTWIGCIPIKMPQAAVGIHAFSGSAKKSPSQTSSSSKQQPHQQQPQVLGTPSSFLITQSTYQAQHYFNWETLKDSKGGEDAQSNQLTDTLIAYFTTIDTLFLHPFGLSTDVNTYLDAYFKFTYNCISLIRSFVQSTHLMFGGETGDIVEYYSQLQSQQQQQQAVSGWNSVQLVKTSSASQTVRVYDRKYVWIDEQSLCRGSYRSTTVECVQVTKTGRIETFDMWMLTGDGPDGHGEGMKYVAVVNEGSFLEMESCIAFAMRSCGRAWNMYLVDFDELTYSDTNSGSSILIYSNNGRHFSYVSSISIYKDQAFIGSKMQDGVISIQLNAKLKA